MYNLSNNKKILKVMVAGGSYLQSNMVLNAVNWAEYGCKAFMEISAGISVLKISRIEPDILILLDNVSWGAINRIIWEFKKKASNEQIILISRNLDKFDSAEYEGIQQINYCSVNAKTLISALMRASQSIKGKKIDFRRRLLIGDTRQFKHIVENSESDKMVILGFELEMNDRNQSDNVKMQTEIETMFALEEYGNCFCEISGRYIFCVDVWDVGISHQLKAINETALRLRKKLQAFSGCRVAVYTSGVVSRTRAVEEYEKLCELEKYRFFLADRTAISVDLVKQEITEKNADWNAINEKYMELIGCAISGKEDKIPDLLKVILRYIIKTGDMNYYYVVMAQMDSILKCISIILSCDVVIEDSLDPDFWCIGDALNYISKKFSRVVHSRKVRDKEYSQIVINAMMTISKKHDSSIYVGSLAEQIGVSASYLSRIFKQQTGMGISKYINYIRVYSAGSELLRENARVSDIAKAHGFSDAKYFSKVFRKITGMTPTEWKNKNIASKNGDRK